MIPSAFNQVTQTVPNDSEDEGVGLLEKAWG